LDKLVKILSHDLRAPMNSVKGLIDIARSEKDPEQFGNYLNMMEKSVKKLEDFTDDIIASLKGRVDSGNKDINLSILVSDIIDELRFASEAVEMRFENLIPTDLHIHSNTTQLRIILSNLISNAIKYSDPSKLDQRFVKIAAEQLSFQISIRIEDNGIGIPETFHQQVFESYFTIGSNANSNGLGLSNVKEAVSKLNGTISLDSKEGVGSTFIVRFPLT